MITLHKLTLRDFAVVSATEIDLGRGMNVITGETGAGKSLVVGAISMLLGERGRSEYVRSGADHAVLEGEFRGDFTRFADILTPEEISIDGAKLLLTRELYADGRSRCLINDQRVNLNAFKKIGERICDLHGQHQHQWLLDPERHLWFLDRYANCIELQAAYLDQLNQYRKLGERISALQKGIAFAREKQDLHRYQVNEINAISPVVGEEERLEIERRQLENIARIKEALQNAAACIEGEGGAIASTSETLKQFSAIREAFPKVEPALVELESIKISFVEMARSCEEYLNVLAEDPERLEQIGERLAQLYQVKRKYGGSIESVLAYRDTVAIDLARSDTQELDLADLRKQLEPCKAELVKSAKRLQMAREAGAKKIASAMRKELGSLGLAKAQFVVDFQDHAAGEVIESEDGVCRLNDSGLMGGRFLFNANVGEELKPLDKIASGGEISRVMLALKSLIAGNDRVDLLVFDEIDSGIGGETALLVGRKLKELSKKQQLIVITHLQQIASFSDQHFKAVKTEKGKRTESELIPLNQNDRIVELGRMISGGKFGEEERRQVEKLLKEAARKVSVDKS
jgi:DNA repair protein RecN (Recombination protein N)